MNVANSLQQDFWNGDPGRKWVALQIELDRLHGQAGDLVVEAAGPKSGQRVLDLGCGAGAICLLTGPLVAPDGTVLGLDISAPLVARAQDRIAETELQNVTVAVADVQTMSPPAQLFDLAVSRFGLMFFEDPIAAFGNIRAFLKPGGRLVFVTWAGSEHNPWFRLPMAAAVERLGPAEPGDPDAPGPLAFRDRDRVTEILDRAGFADIQSREVALNLIVGGGVEGAARLVQHVGPIARHLREMNGDDKDLAAIVDTLRQDFARFVQGDELWIPARVNLFEARCS